MGKAQGVTSSIWSQEVARAVALQRHMPGVQQLQTQYVRYSGQSEAQQCDDGWLLSASRAQAARTGAPQSHHPSDSGTEASMSATGPTSTPTTPRNALLNPTTSTMHASPSPRPGLRRTEDLFRGDAEAMSVSAAPSDACGGVGGDGAAIQLPQQVQLTVMNAPAEFCMPIKRDKRFRPNFQIEEDCSKIMEWLPSEFVPVMEPHDSDELTGSPEKRKRTTRKADKLPLDERLRRRGLKTHTVLSHVFQSPEGKQAATPANRSETARSPSDPGTSRERTGPFFPSSVASPSGPPDPSTVELADNKSLVARSDDPELATRVKLGGVRNTLLAQFEYQRLEFEIPSEVTPVYLVFACLVGNRDLLYTLYTPPSVSMCRRDQQAKSLAVLGLPKNAMQQVEQLKGTSRAAPITPEDRERVTSAPQLSPTMLSTETPPPGPSTTPRSFGKKLNDDSSQSSQAMEFAKRTNKSDPAPRIRAEDAREPFWEHFDREALLANTPTIPNSDSKAAVSKQHPSYAYGDSIPEDLLRFDKPSSATSQSMSTHSRRWSNPPLLDHASLVTASMHIAPTSMAHEIRTHRDLTRFTGEATERFSDSGAGIAANRAPFWANPQEDDMKLMTLPSQASLDKGASLDPWGALTQDMHPDTSHSPLADAGTPQSGSRPPDPHLFPFSQNPSHSCSHPSNEFESGQLNIQMPPPNMATSDPQPHLFRHESDAMSTDDGGMSGGFSGGIPGMAGIPAAPPMFSVPVATGVAQAAVFSWTHQEYCASGTLREITCVEARSLLSVAGFAQANSGAPASQAPSATDASNPQFATTQSVCIDCPDPHSPSLLSLAGFPDLAGVDKNARISTSQFADFKAFFSTTVASVRLVAMLWNARKPSCVLGGFDVDQGRAAEALQPQPVGTFVCFFSMQGQFAGHLVVACKVPAGQAGTDSSAWQPQIAYLAISPDDLQAGNLEGILKGMPYATHVLDVYTGLRHDKRSRLSSAPQHILTHGGPGTAEGSS